MSFHELIGATVPGHRQAPVAHNHAVADAIRYSDHADIRIRLPKTKGRHASTDEEIEQYRPLALGAQQRIVLECGLASR